MMNTRRLDRLRQIGLLVLACGLVISCRSSKPKGMLLIAGSSTMQAYLDPLVKAFMRKNPNVSVVCDSGGASAGVIALKREAIDIAMLSRDVTSEEDDSHLRDYLVARDGVAIVIHPKNPVDGLTLPQLSAIASGRITSWRELPCTNKKSCPPDVPIVLVDRSKTSHLRKSFMDLVLSGEEPSARTKVVQKAEEAIAAIQGNPGAIGYVSLHRLSNAVKAIAINDVEMNRGTMLSGRYPLTRSFYLAVYLQPTKPAESFIEYVVSQEGQTLLAEDGLLKVY